MALKELTRSGAEVRGNGDTRIGRYRIDPQSVNKILKVLCLMAHLSPTTSRTADGFREKPSAEIGAIPLALRHARPFRDPGRVERVRKENHGIEAAAGNDLRMSSPGPAT